MSDVKMWSAKCKKCGETARFQGTREELEAYLDQESFHCNPGHHMELCGPRVYLEVDYDNPGEPEELPTDEQVLADLKTRYRWAGDTKALGEEFEVVGFSFGLCVAVRKATGDKEVLDFMHTPDGTRYYYLP